MNTDFIECEACNAKPGSPLLCPACLNNRAAIGRLQAIVDKLPRAPNGDYLQCPLCRQYLETNGVCPEGCGNIGQWLVNYEKAQTVIDDNARLQAIVDQLPKTADGVLVVGCRTLVYLCHDGTILDVTGWYLYDDGVWGVRITIDDGSTMTSLNTGRVYSTREAAVATKEK